MAASRSTDPAYADLFEIERVARTRLPDAVWDYVSTGADDEVTAIANVEAWQRVRLRPRVLRGVADVDLGVTLLGTRVSLPVVAGPTGKQRLFHHDGELATARAFGEARALMVLSSGASDLTQAIVGAVPGAPRWMQLYIETDRSLTEATVRCAEAAGFGALVLTVDLAPGGRPRVERPGALPAVPTSAVQPAAAISFDDVAWLRSITNLPIAVKGVLRGDDALLCVEAGAAAVVVSNHGGNQLDTAVTTVEALPEVVAAVGDGAEVYVDGGIRRGSSVLKALALGARAVLIGRPVAYGLAAGGAEGVAAALGCLERELRRTMRLCGARTVSEITPDLVRL